MEGFHALFFTEEEIDEGVQRTLSDHHCISQDGKKVRLYIKLLGETCEVVRQITGGRWMMREVLAHSMLYVFAKILDYWLKDQPDCKWNREHGSEKFFQDFLPRYLERGDGGSQFYEAPSVSSAEVSPIENYSMNTPPLFYYIYSRSWASLLAAF